MNIDAYLSTRLKTESDVLNEENLILSKKKQYGFGGKVGHFYHLTLDITTSQTEEELISKMMVTRDMPRFLVMLEASHLTDAELISLVFLSCNLVRVADKKLITSIRKIN